MINIIVAMDRNRNIGLNGDMPWGKDMKSDLAFFQANTKGKTIIMGRKTFDSLPGILPDRTHMVLTTQDFKIRSPFVHVVNSVQEALDMIGYDEHFKHSQEEVFVIGGAEIYKQFLPYTDNIYLTKIHAYLEGDTKFPDLVGTWSMQAENQFTLPASDKDKYGLTFTKYERG